MMTFFQYGGNDFELTLRIHPKMRVYWFELRLKDSPLFINTLHYRMPDDLSSIPTDYIHNIPVEIVVNNPPFVETKWYTVTDKVDIQRATNMLLEMLGVEQ